MIGIYKITSPTGAVYIGQSWNVEKRFSDYKKTQNIKEQSRLYKSILKHGSTTHVFEFVNELPIDVDQEVLNDYEILYIQQYKDCGFEMLNLKSGGLGGKHSQETKDKISEKNKGNKWTKAARKKLSLSRKGEKKPDGFGNKISMALKGRQQRGTGWHHSEKTKLKIRKAQKGKPKSEQHILNNARVRKKPIVQYSLTNKIIKEWDSIADAGRELNKNPSHIGNAIGGRVSHAYGFIWKRKNKNK